MAASPHGHSNIVAHAQVVLAKSLKKLNIDVLGAMLAELSHDEVLFIVKTSRHEDSELLAQAFGGVILMWSKV